MKFKDILKRDWKDFAFLFLMTWFFISSMRMNAVLEKAAIKRDSLLNEVIKKELEIKKNKQEINI
jgi:hypothetical protein